MLFCMSLDFTSLPTVNLEKTSFILPAKLYAGFRGGKGTVGWERSSTWGVAFATCLWDHVGIPGFALLISSVHGSDSGCSAPASDWACVAFATRPDSVPYAKTNIMEQLH